MRALIAVCDDGGFTAAARRLQLSSSAVTRLVSGLERHLGVQLLHRSTRNVRLTRAGETYLARARVILEQVDAAERSAAEEGSAPSGMLRIAAPIIFGRLHVARVIARYMAVHTNVRIELTLSSDYARLIEEGVDVAIRIGALPASTLLTRGLGQTRVVLAASPAYLAQKSAPKARQTWPGID